MFTNIFSNAELETQYFLLFLNFPFSYFSTNKFKIFSV